MKKIIVALLICSVSMSAVARDITVTFADGGQHQYRNAPDSLSPEDVIQRVQVDFPNRAVANLDGGKGQTNNSSWSAGDVLMTIFGVVLIGAAIYYGIDMIKHASAAKTHPCVNPSDIARDGSRCGYRASSVRPGGA